MFGFVCVRNDLSSSEEIALFHSHMKTIFGIFVNIYVTWNGIVCEWSTR